MTLDPHIRDKYQMVVGLEIHAQLNTRSKAYCADLNEYGSAPNSNVGPVSLGMPGTLPVVNRQVVQHAIRLGLSLNCNITESMYFARKNYFYADLPKGYQITQDTTPICTGGHLDIEVDGKSRRIGITRIHMEEDAGKSIHDQDPFDTLIDLNRAGVPLLEIVSEPDIRSSEEAYAYLAEIRKLVRYLDICDGNMEEGSLRCDANISVMLKGSDTFGMRCEVKNMNSLRNVQRAIEHEVVRQILLIESGGTVEQQTRNFDAVSGTTSLLRSKEDAHDYRYFPEPDLQPLTLTPEQIEVVRSEMPPLPSELLVRYTTELGLKEYDARVLTEDKAIALYFEELIQHTPNYKAAANWVMVDVKSFLNQNGIAISEFSLKPVQIAELIDLIDSGKVSHSVASQNLFPALIDSPHTSAAALAEAMNLMQNSDEDSLTSWARAALETYPDKVNAYKSGNKGLLGLFMGEVMKLSNRKADPKAASKILQQLLEE
ncbi:MAG: Asp-tRNA(Asn)/Glu-tRNA(Gln) amidotransferase subunit GatB [Cryomorphaceae bacterium]|nr:MAG: Asp-tRNA(Asn)/Glu-tRNA(Gln) amidotransferase subunit GatB [Cryomorphaceae bacterium]